MAHQGAPCPSFHDEWWKRTTAVSCGIFLVFYPWEPSTKYSSNSYQFSSYSGSLRNQKIRYFIEYRNYLVLSQGHFSRNLENVIKWRERKGSTLHLVVFFPYLHEKLNSTTAMRELFDWILQSFASYFMAIAVNRNSNFYLIIFSFRKRFVDISESKDEHSLSFSICA